MNIKIAQTRTLHPCHALHNGRDIPFIEPYPVRIGKHIVPILEVDCDRAMQMYIDAGQNDRDPYWTEVWPSSVALGQLVASRPELVHGKWVADVGCGLGVAGVAAGLAGAENVTFLDREQLALDCAMVNASAAGLDCCTASRPFDWSEEQEAEHTFDVVMACDVLYESFSVEPVATCAPKLLSKALGSRILLADPPNRTKQNRDRFVELLRGQGFKVEELLQIDCDVYDKGLQKEKKHPIVFMIMSRCEIGESVSVKHHDGGKKEKTLS